MLAPVWFYYELHRFLMPKLQAGDWTWWFIIMTVLIGGGFAYDIASGHYDPVRWWRRRRIRRALNSADAASHPD